MNIEKLRETAVKSHLTRISFEKDVKDQMIITITKQAGNKEGHIVQVVMFDNGNIKDITYTCGGYMNFGSVLETIKDIFEIIEDSKRKLKGE